MAWVRFDDGFTEHPKVLDAGPLGLALQVAAVCYANRALTDGFVPRAKAATLLDLDGLADWQDIVKRLEAAGVWEAADGGWVIHDYLDYQPSREAVVDARDGLSVKRAAAGRAGAAARWQPDGKQHGKPDGNPMANGWQPDGPNPNPNPKTPTGSEPPARVTRARPLPDNWQPNDVHRRIAAERGLDVNLEAERMRDWTLANGAVKKDWDATFRNWLRDERRRPRQQRGRDPGYGPGDLSAAAERLRQQGR